MNTFTRVNGIALAMMMMAACGSDERAATVSAPITTAAAAAATLIAAAPESTAPTSDATQATTGRIEGTDGAATMMTANVSTSATVSTSVTEPSAASDPTSTDDDDAILRLEDLGPGWSVSPLDDSDEPDAPSCSDQAFVDAGIAAPDTPTENMVAEASFQQSVFGPFAIASISRVEQDQAEALIDLLPAALAGCDGTTDSEGNVLHYLPVDFPDVGDATFAVRATADNATFPLDSILAFTRSGDLVLVVAHAVVGDAADPALVETWMRTMIERL
ncbi:MAG: hypothetical protein ABIR32_11690 [Ilumatobacteraceae bacterium]